jgi:hypothetical protein
MLGQHRRRVNAHRCARASQDCNAFDSKRVAVFAISTKSKLGGDAGMQIAEACRRGDRHGMLWACLRHRRVSNNIDSGRKWNQPVSGPRISPLAAMN